MKQETLLRVVHDNPESTILIHHHGSSKVVRVDIDENENFDLTTGEGLKGVDIYKDEKERRKRRKDLKMELKNGGFENIKNVYAISRINENDEPQNTDIKDVQKQQRNRRSPGS
jgi:hypothetical protein